MVEVIQFVSKSDRERDRLIREARAIYDSIFPPNDPVEARRSVVPPGKPMSRA
ncbi:tRNA threonylcarbamoyladenosine modification (KEOPS) complex Pcc1 subunit [Bradyrhizobium elkanii]|nr:tRNA threonylcarbamoyladenosine modification (KEOPS) complex Pcc1 subunit [Bradyrhizobium elkanii]MCS4109933.1 tRNA threonylcarbamoyladenosine modification (KEOPS) complex Pcc1 subunit [Bradyrhizobium elkanii]